MKHLIRKFVIFYALTFYGSKLHCFKLSQNLKKLKKNEIFDLARIYLFEGKENILNPHIVLIMVKIAKKIISAKI